MKNPCIDCITLPICRAMTKDFYEREVFEQIAITLRMMRKCPEVQNLLEDNNNKNIQNLEKIMLRNIHYEDIESM